MPVFSRSGFLAATVALFASACAAPGYERQRISAEELSTLKPQIAEHLICIAGAVDHGLPGTSNALALVDSAGQSCRPKLDPIASGLKRFSLSDSARTRYLEAVEKSSKDVVLERMVSQQAKSSAR